MAQQFFEELSRCLRKEQIESYKKSKLNPITRRTGDWRFFSMGSLSFLFLLGTKYSCFQLAARIQRPTSCITGLLLQPIAHSNMWRPWKTPLSSVLVVWKTSSICWQTLAVQSWLVESEPPDRAMSLLRGSGTMRRSVSAMDTIMRMILQEPNETSLFVPA